MNKGYGEPSTMRSRLSSGSRGPHRFILPGLVLVLLVVGINYWRLASVNADLTERLRQLEELLRESTAKAASLEGARQAASEELRKANAAQLKQQTELDGKVKQLKEMADRLADTDDERKAMQNDIDDLKEKHEQELASETGSLQTQLSLAQNKLRKAEEELTMVKQELEKCSQLSCGDKLKQLQFDLSTCQFAQNQAGNAGIQRGKDGKPMMLAGKQLEKLFETGGMSGFQRPANKPAEPKQGGAVAGPTSVQPAPAADDAQKQVPPPPGADRDSGAGAAADAAAAPGQDDTVPEVAPVDSDPAANGAEPAEEPAAGAGDGPEEAAARGAESAAEQAPVEEAPVEDGAGLISEPEQKPARHAIPRPAPDQSVAQPDYAKNHIKDELNKPDGAADDMAAEEEDADGDQAQRENAALINGLQELSEKMPKPDPAAVEREAAAQLEGGAAAAKPAVVGDGEHKLPDFEDIPGA